MMYGMDSEDDGAGNPTMFALVSERGERQIYRTAQDARLALASIGTRDVSDVWATNLSYDIVNVTWPALDFVFPTFNRMVKVIHARVMGSKTCMRDTLAFLPASVRTLGEMVGLPKLEADFASEEYCARDAEISLRAGMSIRDSLAALGVERMGFSAGGTALAHFERRYWAGARAVEVEAREAYYGGRVEVFRLGEVAGPVHVLDVRSMYPSAMLGRFPLPGSAVDGWREGRPAMVRAEVTIPRAMFGPLPCRVPGGGLAYPVGRVRGTWMSDELEAAIVHHGARVETVFDARTWMSECVPFEGYVSDLWALRQRGGVAKLGAKILLNSLYGKFGQGTERIAVRADDSLPYRWGEKYTFGLVDAKAHPPGTRFVWAASITARARVRLLEMMRAAGDGLLYCDTDCVHVHGKLPDALRAQLGPELGQLDEQACAERADYRAPKVYRLKERGEWDYAAKGFPLVSDDEDASGAALFARGKIRRRLPGTLRKMICLDKRPGVWEISERTLRAGAGNRQLDKDGRTRPMEIRKWQDKR